MRQVDEQATYTSDWLPRYAIGILPITTQAGKNHRSTRIIR